MAAVTSTKTSSAEGVVANLQKVGHFAAIQAVPMSVKVSLYPIERLRLLMQTQHLNKTYQGVSLTSTSATLRHMRSEGLLSPWKGVTPTLVRWFPSQYIHLFMKDVLTSSVPRHSLHETLSGAGLQTTTPPACDCGSGLHSQTPS